MTTCEKCGTFFVSGGKLLTSEDIPEAIPASAPERGPHSFCSMECVIAWFDDLLNKYNVVPSFMPPDACEECSTKFEEAEPGHINAHLLDLGDLVLPAGAAFKNGAHYFCSERCQDIFKAKVDALLAGNKP